MQARFSRCAQLITRRFAYPLTPHLFDSQTRCPCTLASPDHASACSVRTLHGSVPDSLSVSGPALPILQRNPVLSAEKAIEITASATPQTNENVDAKDPQGLKPGMQIKVGPDLESGEQFVPGSVRYPDVNRIAINRTSNQTGSNICVHFPRTGYRIEV